MPHLNVIFFNAWDCVMARQSHLLSKNERIVYISRNTKQKSKEDEAFLISVEMGWLGGVMATINAWHRIRNDDSDFTYSVRPVELAVEKGHLHILKFLDSESVDVDHIIDGEYHVIFDNAVQHGQLRIVTWAYKRHKQVVSQKSIAHSELIKQAFEHFSGASSGDDTLFKAFAHGYSMGYSSGYHRGEKDGRDDTHQPLNFWGATLAAISKDRIKLVLLLDKLCPGSLERGIEIAVRYKRERILALMLRKTPRCFQKVSTDDIRKAFS